MWRVGTKVIQDDCKIADIADSDSAKLIASREKTVGKTGFLQDVFLGKNQRFFQRD